MENESGTLTALFADASEAQAAIAELRLRGFAASSISLTFESWDSGEVEPSTAEQDLPVVFDPDIPPDEILGGGRLLGVAQDEPGYDTIAQSGNTLADSLAYGTAQLVVRVASGQQELARSIIEAHGGDLGA